MHRTAGRGTSPTFRAWRTQVGDDFRFAVKASRFMTHLKRLKAPGPPLDRLLRRVRPLGTTLGPLLVQLPPQFHANQPRLERFLRALGHQRLAPGVRAHDARTQPVVEPVTADFVYVRRHGTARSYHGSYPSRMLEADADRIAGWLADGLDIYVDFNNDGGGAAVRNARRLRELMARRV